MTDTHRTEYWKTTDEEGKATVLIARVNNTWNTVEVTYDLFSRMMKQFGYEKD